MDDSRDLFVMGNRGTARHFFDELSEAMHKREIVLLGASLIAAIVAQYLLDRREFLLLAGVLYAVAVLLFVFLYHKQPMEAIEEASRAKIKRFSWGWVVPAGICGALAFPRFKGNIYISSIK